MKTHDWNQAAHMSRRRNKGFTLLEALIALLVLSIGLLGLAALQARGLSYNHDAYVRSQATYLAYDMIERMRARRMQIDTDAATIAAMNAYTVTPPTAVDCTDSAVADATPNNEVYCWTQRVTNTLPGGVGAIVLSVNGGTPASNYYQVTISWRDRSTPATTANPTPMTVQTWTFQP